MVLSALRQLEHPARAFRWTIPELGRVSRRRRCSIGWAVGYRNLEQSQHRRCREVLRYGL